MDETQKALLHNNTFVIKIFTGSLKEAIRNELQNSGRYIPETLNLSASTGGVIPSETSEELKQVISHIAKKFGLSQEKYFNLITSTDKTMIKYSDVEKEFDNIVIVQDYYMKMFLEELLVHLNAPNSMKIANSSQLYNKQYILEIVNLIKDYGIDNYKKIVDDYNARMKEKQKDGSMLTPQEVITIVNQQKRQHL